MLEIFKILGSVVIDNSKANEELDETTKKGESTQSRLGSAFKKIGAAVVTAFAVDKIIDFGKTCVETAASVKASNSQFEQTFGELSTQATVAMNRVADSSGIMKSRLQDSGTKIYAFAKTTGMESSEALGMMEDALQVAADSAAYYDRSLEDTTETLQSFLKGNFENDAALGLSATETTRNTAANKLYGKSFKDLSESQKQLTLLQMVKDANKLSGALGQAARESDGYENVMGNLNEAWRQFTALIGGPLLSAVIPVIRAMSTGIEVFSETIRNSDNVFKGFAYAVYDMIDEIVHKIPFLGQIWDTTIASFGTVWDSYGRPLFDVLSTTVSILYDSWNVIWPSLQNLFMTFWTICQVAWDSIGKPIFDMIMMVVMACINFFNENWPMIAQIISEVFDLISKYWNDILKPVFEAIGAFIEQVLKPIFEVVFNDILSVVQTTFNMIAWAWNSILKPILNGIIDFVGGVFSGDWSKAWNGIKQIASGIFEGLKAVFWSPIQWLLDKLSGFVDAVTAPFSSAADAIGNIWSAIKSVFKLPHFTMDGSWNPLDWLDDGLPSFGVEWYAKGGLMTGPTAFGINPATGNMMIGGEAGDEAIAPLSKLEEYYKKWSNEGNSEMLSVLTQIRDYLADDERWYRVMLRALTDGSFAVILDGREVGRIVRKYA